jgi:hypothetical protein
MVLTNVDADGPEHVVSDYHGRRLYSIRTPLRLDRQALHRLVVLAANNEDKL